MGQELPKLAEWTASSGPIDFNDWLNLLEPQMSDLTSTSGEWWSLLLKEARRWYEDHLQLPPLQRMGHDVVPSADLDKKKWGRLEKRASTLLLASLPESQREEMVSARKLSAMQILCQLLVAYQPGGLAEKELILRSLELPPEAGNLQEAVMCLRRWTRWRRRALDLGVSEPDPFLLLKGLNRIIRKPLEANRDLSFRISLARSTLQVDATPTSTSITQFSLHLQAEFEQVAHLEGGGKKREQQREADREKEKQKTIKVKRVEEEKIAEEESGKKEGEDKGQMKCRFFLTDYGCKKGKSCTYSHDQQDGRRRCYTCGSTAHMATGCPRGQNRNATKTKQVKVEETETATQGAEKEKERDEGEAVKQLLQEANKMLKSLTKEDEKTKTSSENPKSATLEALQQQLNDLKMKVMKLSRMSKGEDQGLIDSGATHPLRPLKEGEIFEDLRDVMVTLASGEKRILKMSAGGCMVTKDATTEPIIPMGTLVEMGCEIRWRGNSFEVHHPTRGRLEVDAATTGCPQLSREVTLSLIEDWESRPKGYFKKVKNKVLEIDDGMEKWMKELVEVHPVLRSLPSAVKSRLAVTPGNWNLLPGTNGKMRKKWQRDGLVVHLFAGPDAGFTLGRALKQVGGQKALECLLEIDLERGDGHDLLRDDGAYSALISAALQGKLEAIIGGPNCRTRSVLRHYPLPAGRPRPIRSWNGGEYGVEGLDADEKQMIEEDDLMLWRMIYLYMISNYLKKADGKVMDTRFLLEQPASPKEYMPEVVSFWDTREWAQIKEEFNFVEVTMNQGDHGGKAMKPTTFGGDLTLKVPPQRPCGHIKRETIKNSKELSRWAPGVMTMVATAIVEGVLSDEVSMRSLSWSEHIMNHHTPYRRDCRICQETLQRQKPHRRVKHPWAGVLSLDTAGPLEIGKDIHAKAKYLLVGAYTWLAPKALEKVNQEEVAEVGDDVPPLPGDAVEEDEADPGGASEDEGIAEEAEDAEADEEGEDHDPNLQPADDLEIKVYRMVVPMPSKAATEVVKAATELILRLRADGFHVTRIHTDQGKEFSGKFATWVKSRNLTFTRTPGDDPQANGRAEVAVQAVKNMIRRSLHESQADAEMWPQVARHINEVLCKQRRGETVDFPPFGSKVLTRKRGWTVSEFEAVSEEVTYIAPSWANHGHWVRRADGTISLTRYTLALAHRREIENVWIALDRGEDDQDPHEVRRRIRGKQAVRGIMVEDEMKVHMMKLRVSRLIEEEMKNIYEDEMEIAMVAMQKVMELKKFQETGVLEEEEVLQTRIVSNREVLKGWKDWLPAIDSEVVSLLREKEAFLKLDEKEFAEFKAQARREGRAVEELPSKMVWAVKPDPNAKTKGKKKARWVICGNYEEEKGHDTYSGGADSTAFRVLITKAATEQWEAATLDVKTAFLNAEMELEKDENRIVVRPPHILVSQSYFKRSEVFVPLKAVYGLKRSPRLWGRHRDRALTQMQIESEKGMLILVPCDSEPNLWKVLPQGEMIEATPSEILGLLMTYVDDIFVAGILEVVKAVLQVIRSTWTTTEPEFLGSTSVRFLGMEISTVEGPDGRTWKVTQENYVKELLKSEEKLAVRKIPITKDMSEEPETGETSAELVKMALLWLVTRTRPDLMYSVSRMGSMVLKAPKRVLQIGRQVKGFIKGTMLEGLKFQPGGDEEGVLEVFTDASFSPGGEDSHGAVVVCLNGAPIMWRCGRQGPTTLSTAESELQEMVEGMVAGESCYSLVQEICPQTCRLLWSDSQSALSILGAEGGSWRTRHLRLRSNHARRLVFTGEWMIRHTPGVDMVADLGTKPLSGPRLEHLKSSMGMWMTSNGVETAEPGMNDDDVMVVKAEKIEGCALESMRLQETKKALRLITMAAVLQVTRGESEGEEETWTFEKFMVAYTLLVALGTWLGILLLPRLWRLLWSSPEVDSGRVHGGDPSPTGRSRPAKVRGDPSPTGRSGPAKDHFGPFAGVSDGHPAAGHRGYVGRDQERPADEDDRPRGSRDGPFGEPDPRQEVNQPSFTPFSTLNGVRYHSRHDCPALKCAKKVIASEWCPACSKLGMRPEGFEKKGMSIWKLRSGGCAHVNMLCPRARKTVEYKKCSLCEKMTQGEEPSTSD